MHSGAAGAERPGGALPARRAVLHVGAGVRARGAPRAGVRVALGHARPRRAGRALARACQARHGPLDAHARFKRLEARLRGRRVAQRRAVARGIGSHVVEVDLVRHARRERPDAHVADATERSREGLHRGGAVKADLQLKLVADGAALPGVRRCWKHIAELGRVEIE